jgi:hypothetical protein
MLTLKPTNKGVNMLQNKTRYLNERGGKMLQNNNRYLNERGSACYGIILKNEKTFFKERLI